MTKTRSLREIYDRLQKLIQINQSLIKKSRKYIKPGKTPPRGRKVVRGKRGAYYYNTEPPNNNFYPLPGSKPQRIKVSSILPIIPYDEGIIRYRRSELNHRLHDQYFQFREDLSEKEKNALIDYQRDSTDINRAMRGLDKNPNKSTLDIITQIKSAFEHSQSYINEPVLLLKGISADFSKIILDKGGFEDKGFFSASFDPVAAITYARNADKKISVRDADGFYNVLVYRFPGGRGIYLGTHSEILLPHETEWKVVEVDEIMRLRCYREEINTYMRLMIRMIYIQKKEV